MTLPQILLINVGAFVAAIGAYFLKRLSQDVIFSSTPLEIIMQIATNPFSWLGGVCYVIPIFLWAYLLKYIDLTKLQPALAIVYVYTVLISIVFLGETLSPNRFAGISVIIIGVIIVGKS